MKKIVVLTGAGMSAESGFRTFRDSGGLWEEFPVEKVASHQGWLADPDFVNGFYNRLRVQLADAKPNEGHRLVARLEEHYDVTVVTQNVDNLHERAGSSKVIHLHGELMKVCSSRNVEDTRYQRVLPDDDCQVEPGEKAGDGSLLRPYIVFFGESVPKMEEAADEVSSADILIIIGTSLVVYPAAGLVRYARRDADVYLIDPADVNASIARVRHIKKGASAGMQELFAQLVPGQK